MACPSDRFGFKQSLTAEKRGRTAEHELEDGSDEESQEGSELQSGREDDNDSLAEMLPAGGNSNRDDLMDFNQSQQEGFEDEHQDAVPHDEDAVPHDEDAVPHDEDAVPYDEDAVPYDVLDRHQAKNGRRKAPSSTRLSHVRNCFSLLAFADLF